MLSTLSLFILFYNGTAQNTKLANEYFQSGEYSKASPLFEQLSKDKMAISSIHANYLTLLIDKKKFDACEKYLDQINKWFPDNVPYETGFIRLYLAEGDEQRVKKTIQKLISKYETSPYQLNLLSQSLALLKLYDAAEMALLRARVLSGRKSQYALDLAALYRAAGQKEKMINEYLLHSEDNPYNLSYVKSILQSIIEQEEDKLLLETILISKIQSSPDQLMYSDLLIWLEIQRKNFYGAFLQARAIDRRLGSGGSETMKVGQIAMENAAWENALQIYSYVEDAFPEGQYHSLARRLTIKVKEELLTSHFPINKSEIQALIWDYSRLFKELGESNVTLDILYSKARLYAFYLNRYDSAIYLLQGVINNRKSSANLISTSKLLLGDIYLLAGEPWESSLLYSQVEKANKDSPIAYEAKLKNARLSYFNGDFSLAKSHLDILKLATTREISNDAIALSVLIQNNTAFDSTDQIMREYAGIELMIYQNKFSEAERGLNKMLKEYPQHALVDEIHWNLSQIESKKGNYEAAIVHLDYIIDTYGYDILNDDAMYRKGVILEENLNRKEEALAVFIEFLKIHPGSMYAAEARTHIRNLRDEHPN